MSKFRLPTCSIDSAEQALARLWYTLEAHGLPTPEIKVEFFDAKTVSVSVHFREAAHALIYLRGDYPGFGENDTTTPASNVACGTAAQKQTGHAQPPTSPMASRRMLDR